MIRKYGLYGNSVLFDWGRVADSATNRFRSWAGADFLDVETASPKRLSNIKKHSGEAGMSRLAKMRMGVAMMLAGMAMLAATPSAAKVVRLTIEKTTPLADGYELLEGHFTGALDPNDKRNAIITDLKLAPRNAAGMVEYYSTFAIARPTDPAHMSGLLVYDVPNRGRGQAKAIGAGHVSVVNGWQGDVDEGPGVQFLRAPVVHTSGPAYVRFIDMPAGTTTMPVKGGPQGDNDGRMFEAATADGAHLYTLVSDGRPQDQVEVPRGDWAFADCAIKPFPGVADLSKICVKGGFNPKLGYTLAFNAKDPKVLAVGFASTRDLVSFLRYDQTVANPLAGKMRWAVGRGESQSGNYIRGYVNLGFNTDEAGRMVFDGLQPIIAVRHIAMNYRFGSPGGLVDLYELGQDGVNWWGQYDDVTRGQGRHSLLDRCTAEKQCPKITEVMGSAELWYHRGGVDYAGTDAKADIPLPANVRRYYNASVTHGGGPGGFSLKSAPARNNSCVLPSNPNPSSFVNRAIFAALADWVMTGREPPPSAYPTIAAGDLISHDAFDAQYVNIPGAPKPVHAPLNQYDFSHEPGFRPIDESGVLTMTPPRFLRTLPLLVPRTDADGNELAGIRSPLLAAPLGTYLGWNPTATGYRTGRYCFSTGGFIPFAVTREERIAKGDPRPSLQERYPSHAAYVAKVKAQADALVAKRYMLAEDAAKTVAEAEAAAIP
jgi:hypothetical protein